MNAAAGSHYAEWVGILRTSCYARPTAVHRTSLVFKAGSVSWLTGSSIYRRFERKTFASKMLVLSDMCLR